LSSFLSNHNHSRGDGVGERPDDYRVMSRCMADVVGTIHGRTNYCKGTNGSLSSRMDTLRVVVRALTSCDDSHTSSGFNNGEYLTCGRVDCTYNKMARGVHHYPRTRVSNTTLVGTVGDVTPPVAGVSLFIKCDPLIRSALGEPYGSIGNRGIVVVIVDDSSSHIIIIFSISRSSSKTSREYDKCPQHENVQILAQVHDMGEEAGGLYVHSVEKVMSYVTLVRCVNG
jgi:hypothetical protein